MAHSSPLAPVLICLLSAFNRKDADDPEPFPFGSVLARFNAGQINFAAVLRLLAAQLVAQERAMKAAVLTIARKRLEHRPGDLEDVLRRVETAQGDRTHTAARLLADLRASPSFDVRAAFAPTKEGSDTDRLLGELTASLPHLGELALRLEEHRRAREAAARGEGVPQGTASPGSYRAPTAAPCIPVLMPMSVRLELANLSASVYVIVRR